MVSLKYRTMIGVGGIGSGSFFALTGNHTLGREESRGGRFLDRRDYCKLHIISHYVQTLLGEIFNAILVGKVGDDQVGARLIEEMSAAGIDIRYVKKSTGDQTLFSFCFIYPDGSGGNLTTDDSACSRVDPDYVEHSKSEFERYAGQGIALAVPEVPMQSRVKLLQMATEHGFFRVASFSSEEMGYALKHNMLSQVDLLAVNIDEASAATGIDPAGNAIEDVVKVAVQILSQTNPNMMISITAGCCGSWIWDGKSLIHEPKHNVRVSSTAGAGDAHLSGIIAGLASGLSLRQSQKLGNLVAAMSVTSLHTINKKINRKSLRAFADDLGADTGVEIRPFLEEAS